MIYFEQLLIGTNPKTLSGGVRPCPRCLRATSQASVSAEPVSLSALETQIQKLSTKKASVMLRGFEPFQHPELVGIVQTLASSQIRRLGMRTDAAALANPDDARGCIDFGVRVFEIPFLPREMDALSQAAPLEASLAGIAGIRNAAAVLDAKVFVCTDIYLCKHTAPYFVDTVQVAIAAGIDAIRLSIWQDTEPVSRGSLPVEPSVLNAAHAAATQSSIVFFGDGCEEHLAGATLYEVGTAD